MIFNRFFTSTIRRWGYAIGEVMSIAIAGFCFSVLFITRAYHQFGDGDPGMAKATAICLSALAVGLFVICNSLKQIDHEK
jgi:hypothetical protein